MNHHCHNCPQNFFPYNKAEIGAQSLPCVEAVPVVKVRKDWLNGIELI